MKVNDVFDYKLIKFVIILLPLWLTSCHHDQWESTSIQSRPKHFSLSRLSYPSSNPNNGIELEMTRFDEDLYAYINIHRYTLPIHQSNETYLTIQTPETQETFFLPLLEGEQRARLTQRCLEYLLSSLSHYPTITLSTGHFSQVITSENFQNHYRNFLKQPNALSPENLINFKFY